MGWTIAMLVASVGAILFGSAALLNADARKEKVEKIARENKEIQKNLYEDAIQGREQYTKVYNVEKTEEKQNIKTRKPQTQRVNKFENNNEEENVM